MDRRNFLRGTFGGVAAGGIIIASGIPDTQAFMESVKIGDPVAAAAPQPGAEWPDMGDLVFNYKGQPIGVVSDYNLRKESIRVTQAGDEYDVYAPGMRTLTYTVVATGAAPVRLGYGR